MRYWGFNDVPSNHEKYLSYVASIGATAARMPLWWDQPTNSPAQEHAVAALASKGIGSILHLSGQGIVDPTEYGEHMRAAAKRFPCSTLEAWNEPNYAGYGLHTPEQAAALNDAAALAAPGRVLGSAVAPGPLEPTDPLGHFAYQDRMYAAMQHRDKLLGISVHVYPWYYDPSWQFTRAIDWAAKWGLPVWVTEWNLRGSVYSGADAARPKQAPTAARMVTQLDRDPRVRAALWHALDSGDGVPPADEVALKVYATQLPELTYAFWGAFKQAAASP